MILSTLLHGINFLKSNETDTYTEQTVPTEQRKNRSFKNLLVSFSKLIRILNGPQTCKVAGGDNTPLPGIAHFIICGIFVPFKLTPLLTSLVTRTIMAAIVLQTKHHAM